MNGTGSKPVGKRRGIPILRPIGWMCLVCAAAVASAPVAHTRTSGAQVTPSAEAAFDYGRLVRVWVSPPGGRRSPTAGAGERIVMAGNVPAAADLALLASAGFTLLQTDSDHQSTEEVRPGFWDFSGPDRARALASRAGFDWCYFPHFAFPPPWYAEKIQFPRVRCLEHDQTIEAFSPWDPNYGYFLDRGYRQLAKHYAGEGTAPALYLGVHGDYGEAGMFIGARVAVPGQREAWQQRFGNLHNHVGWWCGDPLARQAFRNAMLTRYGSLDALNRAWKTSFAGPDAVAYPPAGAPAARRFRLDWMHWYRDSVSAMTDMVCRVARRHFPNALLMVPVGFADEDPRNGADMSMVAKVAARYGAAIRSTHGGFKGPAENQATMLGRLASAARFYGADLWTEPPSTIAPQNQAGRIFETVSLGGRGHFDWAANVGPGRDAYYRFGKHMRHARRVVDVAMFFPTTSHLLSADAGYPQTLARGCAMVRDVLDFDILDERMIMDGALDRFRVLALWEGAVVEAGVLERIKGWVERGGVLVAYDFGKIETVEGSADWFRDVLGYAGKLTQAAGGLRYVGPGGGAVPTRYRVSVGEPSAAPFLDGDWYAPETMEGVRRRWTGENAEVRLPVSGRDGVTLSVRVSFPPEAAGLRREVLVNGAQVGILDLAGEHTYRFDVPANMVQGRNVLKVAIRCKPFVPSSVIKGSGDNRRLGAWVTYVQVQPASVRDSGLIVPELGGRLEVSVSLRRLRTEWARQLGRGWTIYFPARRDQLAAYCEVVRYATYNLSDLDASKADAPAIDNAWDGVYATLCTDRALYYNSGAERVLRTIVLSPSALAAVRDVHKPAAYTHELSLEPRSIAAIPFAPTGDELLLQCEKFTQLGGIAAQEGSTFSPGTGATHVLIPAGGSISTRFECPSAGTYRVFYRTSRRGALARAQVLLDGRQGSPVDLGPRRLGNQTMCAGTMALSRGIHTLTIRPLPGQDLRADFVVLSSDTTIAGYGFAVR